MSQSTKLTTLMHEYQLNVSKSPFHLHFEEINSTQDYLRNSHTKPEYCHGTVISADFQSAGIGQYGRNWQGNKNDNAYFSILLESDISVDKAFLWNMYMTTILADYFNRLLPTKIKWPNDLVVDNHKFGGILIQNVILGKSIRKTMLGVGINVNQSNFSDLPKASSLRNMNIFRNPSDIIQDLIPLLMCGPKNFNDLSTEKVIDDYCEYLWGYNQVKNFSTKDDRIEARIIGVNVDGSLLVIAEGRNNDLYHPHFRLVLE